MVFRNLSLFVIMNGGDGESRPVTALRLCPASSVPISILCGGGGADRLLRFRSHAASSQAPSACSDRALFESPQDFLTDGHALRVRLPPRLQQRKK